jgi:hypothetical protein
MGMRLLPRDRRRPGRRLAACPALILSACLAIAALAGCAVVRAPSPQAHAPSPAPPSSGTPQERAVADAGLMLKAFAPPAGAREVSGSPVPGSVMSRAPATPTPMDDDVVTGTSWWLAPGDPQQVLAWEKAHLPSLYRYFGGGTTATGVWNDVFNIAAVPGLFDERELAVSTTAAGGGQTAIRVDALVDWIPVRPGGDTIPATATNLALVLTSNVSHTGQPVQKVTATATITDAATVREIAAYLSTLPVQPPGAVYNCPPNVGGTLTLTFRSRPGGRALATASAIVSGCQDLQLTVPGGKPLYWQGDAGEQLFDEVVRVTGLKWQLPMPPALS